MNHYKWRTITYKPQRQLLCVYPGKGIILYVFLSNLFVSVSSFSGAPDHADNPLWASN